MPHFHTNSPTVAGSVLLCSSAHSLSGSVGQMCLCSNCSPRHRMPLVLRQPSPASALWWCPQHTSSWGTTWHGSEGASLARDGPSAIPAGLGGSLEVPPAPASPAAALLPSRFHSGFPSSAEVGKSCEQPYSCQWQETAESPPLLSLLLAFQTRQVMQSAAREGGVGLQLGKTQLCWAAEGPGDTSKKKHSLWWWNQCQKSYN